MRRLPRYAGSLKNYFCIVDSTSHEAHHQQSAYLIDREREVLQIISDDRMTKELVDKIYVNISSVESQPKNVTAKLGPHTVAEFAQCAVQKGMYHQNKFFAWRRVIYWMVRLKRHWLAVYITFILIYCAPPVRACPLDLPTARAAVDSHVLIIELATTPESRSCGLSLRSKLPPNRGMLFVYTEPETLTFWMKNTRIPLSIAFIDCTGRIIDIQKMNPLPVHINYVSPVPVPFALEVNQEWFENNGIGIGDKLIFDFPATLEIR